MDGRESLEIKYKNVERELLRRTEEKADSYERGKMRGYEEGWKEAEGLYRSLLGYMQAEGKDVKLLEEVYVLMFGKKKKSDGRKWYW